MDDRELMDKIRKSMEDTPVPDSLKPENVQKMLEEQSKNQQPNEAARTEKEDQPKGTATHRFWNARTSRYIGAAAAVVVIAALGITPGMLKTRTGATLGDTTYTASNDAQTASESANETALEQADIQSAEESDTTEFDTVSPEAAEPVKVAQATDPVSGIAHMDSYDDLYNMLKEWNENPTTSNYARVMTIEESADTGSANTAAASDMASADAASPDSVIAAYPEGEIDSAFSYDEKSDSGDYSSTNTQEEMVDEADIVKTDGTYIYAMDSKGTIRIVDAASMKLIGTINGENSADYKDAHYLVSPVKALVFKRGTLQLSEPAQRGIIASRCKIQLAHAAVVLQQQMLGAGANACKGREPEPVFKFRHPASSSQSPA